MLFNAALIITRAASLIAGGLVGDSRVALALFSATGTVLWAWFCFYLISTTGLGRRSMLAIILGYLSGALLFVLPAILAKWVWGASSLIILLVSVSASALYYLRLFAHDNDLRTVALGLIPARRQSNR